MEQMLSNLARVFSLIFHVLLETLMSSLSNKYKRFPKFYLMYVPFETHYLLTQKIATENSTFEMLRLRRLRPLRALRDGLELLLLMRVRRQRRAIHLIQCV